MFDNPEHIIAAAIVATFVSVFFDVAFAEQNSEDTDDNDE